MRKEEPDGFITHQFYFGHLLKLDNETLGGIYRNLILNFMGEEENSLDGAAYVIADLMNDHIQRDVKAYTERCRRNKENARKRWEKLQDNANDATASDCIRPYTNDATASDRIRLHTNDATASDCIRPYAKNANSNSNSNSKCNSNSNSNVNININKKEVCALQADAPAALMPYTLLLKDGTYHRISESDFKNLQEAFPNVNLDTEFKKMVLWCSDPANAQKRKTKKGIMKFIRSWLGRVGTPVVIQKPEPANKVHEERRYDFDALEKALTGRG